jgi:integrase
MAMASIYARGDMLWIKFKNEHGKPECRSSKYRVGQEAMARELAAEVERQAALKRASQVANGNAPVERAAVMAMPSVVVQKAALVAAATSTPNQVIERIGPQAAPGALTVAEYIEQWIKMRSEVETWKSEAGRLRIHVVPLIGHMAIADVRPKHIRDLINAIKKKTSDAAKCKDKPLAPRTIRLIFATLRLVFKSAIIDEHIAASPVVLEAGVLPKNVDKDPAWRSTAIFEREELVSIISDRRIPLYRRMMYGLEGLAGVRHGEAAALRWSDRNKTCAPLCKLTVSRSGEKARTKTQLTREIPIHPALAALIDEWETTGWEAKFGRKPTPNDLLVPTEDHRVRKPQDSLKKFHQDLTTIGLRARRGHDLRRTFITLIRVDGGRTEVLRPITHPGEKDIIGLYTTFPWPVVCEELSKLRIEVPAVTNGETTEPDADASDSAGANEIVAANDDGAASYSASYTPECSSEINNDVDDLQPTGSLGVPFRKP